MEKEGNKKIIFYFCGTKKELWELLEKSAKIESK